MSDLFNSEKGGIENLYGWMGQVVDESCWVYNHSNSDFKHKLHSSKDIAGYGYRYKVRIFGRDVSTKDIPDDQLEMAEVLLPVTSGSGHGGSVQTPNIRQGMYVWGFYKDGMDATEPIIVGVLPNNSQTTLFGGDPDQNFIPRSGYIGLERTLPVSTKNIKLEGPSSLSTNEGINATVTTVAHEDQKLDGKRRFYVPKTINCDGSDGEIKGLQKIIKQLLKDIQRIKRFSQSFSGAVSDLASNITSLINDVTVIAASIVKSLMMRVRGYVVNSLNKKISQIIEKLPPNRRPNLVESVRKSTDTIQCTFNKIVSRLSGLVEGLLNDIVEKYVNAPLCAAEAFVGNFISSILGDLTSGITSALSFISEVTSGVTDSIFSGLDVLTGVLKFLSCEEELNCQILDEWSFWDGSQLTVDNILGEKVSEKIRGVVNQTAPGCSYSQLPCGPPKLQLYGNGSGVSGNVVVSPSGYIMGIDILSGGQYISEPIVKIVDDCGSGNDAVVVPILATIPSFELDDVPQFTIDNFIVIDPGFGYLNYPDGSTGGGGGKFSGPCDTIVGVSVYTPGQNVVVKAGDIVYLPYKTTIDIFDSQNEIVQIINGLGQLTPLIVEFNGTFVTPECASDSLIGVGGSSGNIETVTGPTGAATAPSGGSPVSIGSSSTYPVVVSICDLAVLNGGINYSPSDTIQVIPNNGINVKPIFDSFGKLLDVEVSSCGVGYEDIPEIRVISETGYNAVLVPVFKFDRIKNQEDLLNITPGVPLINVVDCVGKL
jgi:hypothetical protein